MGKRTLTEQEKQKAAREAQQRLDALHTEVIMTIKTKLPDGEPRKALLNSVKKAKEGATEESAKQMLENVTKLSSSELEQTAKNIQKIEKALVDKGVLDKLREAYNQSTLEGKVDFAKKGVQTIAKVGAIGIGGVGVGASAVSATMPTITSVFMALSPVAGASLTVPPVAGVLLGVGLVYGLYKGVKGVSQWKNGRKTSQKAKERDASIQALQQTLGSKNPLPGAESPSSSPRPAPAA